MGGLSRLGLERYFIFMGSKEVHTTPRHAGLAYEDVWFQASDGVRLNGWFIPAPNARATFLWCHGNAGTIADRVDNIQRLHHLIGVNVFIFDYRGYGQSDGTPSEAGLYRDAEAARTWLLARPEIAGTRLVYFGRSLGSAVAVELARRHPPDGLIIETPFTSIADMARLMFPWVPVGPLLRMRFDSLKKIPSIHVPLLIVHGDRDSLVPHTMGQRLFEAANPPKRLYTVPGADHNDTYLVGGTAYFAELQRFLESL